MRARSAHIQARERSPISAEAKHRSRAVQLIERQRAVKYVAADQPELALKIERRQDFAAADARLEIRRVPRDCVDHEIGHSFFAVVPASSIGQRETEVLAEKARN